MAISFDGVNKIITLDALTTEYQAYEIYSEWKAWAITGDNLKFSPAFRVIGGDPISNSVNAGSYFFLNNVDGWVIKSPEAEIDQVIYGNIYPENAAGASIFAGSDGPYSNSIRVESSSLTQEKVITSGSGLSAEQAALLEAIATKTAQLAFSKANELNVNVKSVNDSTIGGSGTENDPWGP